MDEFDSNPFAILFRNLVRAVGMTCILANTDTTIANLSGSASQQEEYDVWSILFTQMNSLSFQLDSCSSLQNASFDPAQYSYYERFFNYLKVSKLRPGIHEFLIEAIESLNMEGSFVDFLDSVINEIGHVVDRKKTRINGSVDGRNANMALCFDYAYCFDEINMNRKTYLKNHLYFMENPTM